MDSLHTWPNFQKRSSISSERPFAQQELTTSHDPVNSDIRFRSSIRYQQPHDENREQVGYGSYFDSRFPLYGLDWTYTQDYKEARIALSSYREDATNYVRVIGGTPGTSDTASWNFHDLASASVRYPVTRLQWDPSQKFSDTNKNRFATTSECLRLYEVDENHGLIEKLCLANSKVKNFNQLPPLTSFDWNVIDPQLIITCSIDTTCTLWDISHNSGVTKTQLIAHDSEVFDVKFIFGNKNIFCSCSSDGSVRVFDLRNLEHSTIVYEPQTRPIILILDLRYPGVPLVTLDEHRAPVNSVQWHPSKNLLLSGSDDGQVLIWDMDRLESHRPYSHGGQHSSVGSIFPTNGFSADMEVNNTCWDPTGHWVAVNITARVTRLIRLNSSVADVSSTKYKASCFPSKVGLRDLDTFPRRHLGPRPNDVNEMLKVVEAPDIETFVSHALPPNILVKRPLKIDPAQGLSESAMLKRLKQIASKNKVLRSYIGKGYYGTHMPAVIQRNIMENPAWYTSYTPYQAEVSQGRLESLLNFQTLISDLTGLSVANSSLLDEGTAAAEAMIMAFHNSRGKRRTFVVDQNTHEQTIAVISSRANTLGLNLVVTNLLSSEGIETVNNLSKDLCGALVSYPGDNGSIPTITALQRVSDVVHNAKGLLAVDADILSLTLMHPPSAFGADIALGSTQRFGVPMGFGGPHAAFFSVRDDLKRKMPGRLVGISTDRLGNPALRLALQTREQHIRREKATSNICTAQALLANIASSYAVYHGPVGLRNIAKRTYGLTALLARAITTSSKHKILGSGKYFDTLRIELKHSNETASQLLDRAVKQYGINIFKVDKTTVQLSLDETVTKHDLIDLIELFTGSREIPNPEDFPEFPEEWKRKDQILTNPVFHEHHSETAMLRYLYSLQEKDIALTTSMISLGSCTMKLNGTVEMMPITWPEFADLHPFAPRDQAKGYMQLIEELEHDLEQITGFAKTTLMPNSGAQGEYTGLSVIRQYHHSHDQSQRNIVLIPVSAHGTNPASATMAGFKVVPVKCLENGSLDMADMQKQAEKNKDNLAAFMITYPTTYGLFEPGIRDAINLTHKYGGQVYMDGANMNAQVGLTSPADLGADVCHLNLHKTFCIPHGGGGPGVGPICVAEHLKNYLPKHPLAETSNLNAKEAIQPVSSAPFGSASILPISYAYIKMMGGENIPYSSVIAILNANYMLYRLKDAYKIMFIGTGETKYCGHEFIIDLRPFKKYHIEAIDVAKRLQDYGFHAPTMAFPIPDTLMVEPTESENRAELDRFVDAMLGIREEIRAVEEDKTDGLILKNSPHTIQDLMQDDSVWLKRGYTREQAAYPLPYLKNFKTWPSVARVDDVYGDTHLMCTCPPLSAYNEN
ncbi:hypothetical protein FOA43_001235 [Brettanomyces nanus]|uniref:glycine dehydrogenase (aminomethyl-transferring) n=1 Tax=Eeniella nana TaxID=13502 RepID=A0A875RNN1_EENNA|nr:uncharacterized protein FOA43_001235 [Brettanomyces nanus]QPG73920.1 hypothetical protein FOA43_001235 [Brettanomyces nanus]